ncbi:Nuclear-pore anchor [Camellia lanceoleosa]|uniref:Nuclear-pore anchor n=1 Tax=Camellia lanceoleosa TaxID=1840588 RepID=A0ACC0GSQ7_9ERIC|nr:Nuclear-pore anchor [Camellia lanceoleosa]
MQISMEDRNPTNWPINVIAANSMYRICKSLLLDDEVEHERLVEAYSVVNQKLKHSLSEQTNLERTIQKLTADSRRCERDYSITQKEIVDLQKQVTIIIKECRDVQLR